MVKFPFCIPAKFTKSIEELNKELNNAVRNEDFDLAQKIQEEIKSRNKKID